MSSHINLTKKKKKQKKNVFILKETATKLEKKKKTQFFTIFVFLVWVSVWRFFCLTVAVKVVMLL